MRSIRLVNLLMILGALAAALPIAVSASPADAPLTQTNLLKNPSFEEGFTNGVANQWARWSVSDPNATPQNNCGRKDPSYQQASTSLDPRRVKDGSSAQQILTPVQDPGLGFYAGLQQTITGITPGKTYRFSVWASSWSSTGDNPALSEGTGPVYFEVGIGQGSTYAADPNVKRSGVKDIKDTYQQLSVDIVASGNTLTVFTYANPSACSKHNEAFFDGASLAEVGPAATAAPTQPPQPTLRIIPTKFPTPTPNTEGKIVYTVQPGNTIIDICGVIGRGSDPSCIDDIMKWNGLSNPRGIYVGQQLIIGQVAGYVPPSPTAAPTETPAAQATDSSATATEISGGQPTTPPEAQASLTPAGASSICVTLFNDANGNGVFDPTEGKVAGGNFALLDVANSNTVASYATDGASEPHCFENLPGGSYRISSTVPDGYKATTRSDWDLTLAAGSTANLEFGAQSTGEPASTGGGSDGGSSNSARLIRALLAAAGVVLLLIAAGVAGFLVLTRRR